MDRYSNEQHLQNRMIKLKLARRNTYTVVMWTCNGPVHTKHSIMGEATQLNLISHCVVVHFQAADGTCSMG